MCTPAETSAQTLGKTSGKTLRCSGFMIVYGLFLRNIESHFPRSLPRSQQDSNILIILYFIIFYFILYFNSQCIYLCLFSTETSAQTLGKTSEMTLRCLVFMIVYGLFWEISRVITNIPFIKIQIGFILSMLCFIDSFRFLRRLFTKVFPKV